MTKGSQASRGRNVPAVSVIIPTYNRAELVCEAIDSVLAQTFTEHEVIVVDDGSTDGTGDLLRLRYGDRIRYVYQANAGRSVARNRGVEVAGGTYVAFLDSDDLWLPDKLERMISFMSRGRFEFAGHMHDLLDTGVRVENPQRYQGALPDGELPCPRHALVTGTSFQPITAMCTARLFTQSGGFPPRLSVYEDMIWFWRTCVLARTGFLPERLLLVRVHPQRTARLTVGALAQRVEVLSEMFATAGVERQTADELKGMLGRALFQYASALRVEGRGMLALRAALEAVRRRPSAGNVVRLVWYLLGRDFRCFSFWRGQGRSALVQRAGTEVNSVLNAKRVAE